jgi:hypothetical protein
LNSIVLGTGIFFLIIAFFLVAIYSETVQIPFFDYDPVKDRFTTTYEDVQIYPYSGYGIIVGVLGLVLLIVGIAVPERSFNQEPIIYRDMSEEEYPES